jgi:HK97 family phage major capsid protein
MATLYEMKEKLATVGGQLQAIEAELVEKAANPAIPMEEIKNLEGKRDDIKKRFDLLQNQHDKMEEEQRTKLRQQNLTTGDEKAQLIAAKAEFYRAKILGRSVSDKALEILNANPLVAIPASDGTGGEDLLPTTMVNTLIHEPFAKNPLRPYIGMSAIAGLELPKIAYTLDDDGFINDSGTLKEIQLTGDKVSFGRFKFKVKARIADTVLHGSDANLVGYVENALRSGLAAKERKCSFAAAEGITAAEAHMSFYEDNESSQTLIETVSAETMYAAITAAIADLDEEFRENAKVCMRYADYVTLLSTLSNSSKPLYGVQPEEIIGKPVFFCDAATTPIVGDFKYYHLNYHPQVIFDADKDVDKGEYIWVLTAWFDQQFLLRSAFRLAAVNAG